jgi:hypothetical protein
MLRRRSAPRACVNYMTNHPRNPVNWTQKSVVRKRQCCRKSLPRRHFRSACIRRSSFDRCHRAALSRRKPHRADSESRFLAIKKFSCSLAWRLINARQTRFFSRIEFHRFALGIVRLARHFAAYGERSLHTRANESETPRTLLTSSRAESDPELGLEQLVHGLRVGPAAG